MSALRVLLIDDEEDLVRTMAERLNLRGFEAEGVSTGEEAVARVTEKEYDVAVLDLGMPRLRGGDLLERIRKERPGLQVLVMTSYGAVHEGEMAVKKGAYDYLMKPYDIDTLAEMMRESVDSR